MEPCIWSLITRFVASRITLELLLEHARELVIGSDCAIAMAAGVTVAE
jgi:hypothetical protein